MLPQPLPTRQQPASPDPSPPLPPPARTPLGVGIDTSRYGHYAAFLNAQLQPACPELQFPESASGYQQLRQRLLSLVHKHGPVLFQVRLDAAGTYADNLLAFLEQLALDQASFCLSCGDTQRNKNYRVAVYGHQKSDPVEARACARYALTERPKAQLPLSPALRRLRQVASRLQAVVRQRTRLVNQLHQLLARTYPELALLLKDITVGWCLELLSRFPTARRLAQAASADLQAIPYLPHERIDALLARAADSVASLEGAVVEELVRDQVRQVRDVCARQKRLESLLIAGYRELPEPNHLDTIKGLGDVTAAILTAFMVDVNRFVTPGQLVNYFGVLPIEASSGVDRDGQRRGPKRYVMSRRGNDLVRRYLWMAALSAARFNPACRALYARVRAKHPEQPSIAIGHVMRKLLHLAFAIWKTGKPFNPQHYPWEPAETPTASTESAEETGSHEGKQAAGLKPDEPARSEVTATRGDSVAPEGETVWVEFEHVKAQLTMQRVLDHLGLSTQLKGTAEQRRCACPIHRGDGRGKTFSVNLQTNRYQCFAAACGSQGDVIDLWSALHRQSLREAALDLVRTFGLEPAPQQATEKRNG